MEPFYFGEPEHALFGVYHPPMVGPVRGTGVVLCHPMGQEYMRAHRALLRLAILLAGAGFHVMRFDLSGCGDSWGDCSQWRISRWVDDIALAVGELQSGCDATSICLMGLRLGGTVSMMAGANRDDVDGIVLWDPVVDGRSYRKEIVASHDEWLRGSFAEPKPNAVGVPAAEVLGFPLTEAMVEELDKVDLLSLRQSPGRKMYLVECEETAGCQELAAHLRGSGCTVSYDHVASPKVWTKNEGDMEKGLVPSEILEAVLSWISRSLP